MEHARQRGHGCTMLVGFMLAGLGATVLIYAVMKWLTVHGSKSAGIFGLLVGGVAFLLVGWLVGFKVALVRQRRLWWRAFKGAAAAYGGVAAGVFLWATVEDLVFSRFGKYPIYEEHNLFPFEIIMWWLVAAIPMMIGICLSLGRSQPSEVARDKAPDC